MDLSPKLKGLIGLAVIVVLLAVGGGLSFFYNVGNNVGYAPEQPIPFSHKLHAGDNEIPCMYCHNNVDKSPHANVPPMETCMNCHKVVKTDSPWIQKVTKHYNEKDPIEWIKVHDLPDHAFFNHKRHIKAGVDCSTCHGDVAQMEKIEQVETLNMGFCVSCHKENNAPLDCVTCHK